MTGATNGPPGLVPLRRVTWLTMLGCLVAALGLVAGDAVDGPAPTAASATILAALLACAVAGRFFAVAVLGTAAPVPPVAGLLVGAAGLAAGAVLSLSRSAASEGFAAALPLAALLAAVWCGTGWPRWPASTVGPGIALGASALGSGVSGAVSWTGALTDAAITALCAAALYAQVWMLGVGERLGRAGRWESAAAVAEERLRFAADLHDIQGHSLQVIALKSELAERLADADPAGAAAQMREVQALARQALGDTREVVNGYRAVCLDTEIANATRVLAAAGIESSMSRAAEVPPLPSGVEKLLGLVVRECTTNVLRHSTARNCEVALTLDGDTVVLCFSNDGPLSALAGPAGGLAGLADRLTAAGGRLVPVGTAQRFTVSAYLPVPVRR